MKSKTKTILIFAAILAAAFLIAFLDGGAVQSAADALPETLAAPEHAALLVTAMQSVDGTTERTLCTQDDLFSRAYVPSTLSGLLRVVDVSLDWGEDET